MAHSSKAFVRLLTVLAVILSMAGFAASHQAAHAAGSSGGYVPVSPQRLASAVSVAGGHYTNVQVVGIPGVVPADAIAVDVTVTGTDASTSFLTAYPDTGGQQPFVTTVSLNPNQTTADSAIVAPGPDGKIAIYNNVGNASVYVDLYGYYESGAGAGFQALSPSVRFAGPVTVNAGVPAVIQVGGAHGLPSSGGVIAATLTGANDTQGGNLVCYGDGTTRPATSNVNLTVGVASSVLVQCPVGSDGKVDIYSPVGTVSIDLDVSGYYSGQSAGVAYNVVTPTRVANAVTLSSSSTLNITVAGVAGVPSGTGTVAVAADVTVAGCTQHGYIEAYAAGSSRPNPDTSILNDQLGAAPAVTDLATLPPGTNGQVTFRLGTGATGTCKLYVDINGYFGAPGGGTPPPVTSPPPVTNSLYTNFPSGSAGLTPAHNAGCTEAQADSPAQNGKTSVSIFDVGGPTGSNSVEEIDGTFLSYADVVADAESYADGFQSCIGASTDRFALAIGTNNSTSAFNASASAAQTLGSNWASMVIKPVSQHVSADANVSAAAAIDAEPGFGAMPNALAWITGYEGSATSAYPVYNFGSADGCPESTDSGDGCNNGWTQEGIWQISGGDHPTLAAPLPEIYYAVNATQWHLIGVSKSPSLVFAGAQTEYRSDHSTNTPAQGWTDLYNAVKGQQSGLAWSTDN